MRAESRESSSLPDPACMLLSLLVFYKKVRKQWRGGESVLIKPDSALCYPVSVYKK